MTGAVFTLPATEQFNASRYLVRDQVLPDGSVGPAVVPGYLRVDLLPAGVPSGSTQPERVLILAAPGYPVLPEALETAVPAGVAYTPEQLAIVYPELATRVFEAEYEETEIGPDGEPRIHRVRCRMIDLPEGITPVATNLLPCDWAGND